MQTHSRGSQQHSQQQLDIYYHSTGLLGRSPKIVYVDTVRLPITGQAELYGPLQRKLQISTQSTALQQNVVHKSFTTSTIDIEGAQWYIIFSTPVD